MIRLTALAALLLLFLAACGGDDDASDEVADDPDPTPTETVAAQDADPTATPAPESTPTTEPEPTATPEPTVTPEPEPEPTETTAPEPEPTPDFTAEFDEAEMTAILDELEYWLELQAPFEQFASSTERFDNAMNAPDEAWDDPGFRQNITYIMGEWSMIYQQLGLIQPPEIFEAEHTMLVQGFGYLSRSSELMWEVIWQDGTDDYNQDLEDADAELGAEYLGEGFTLIEEAINRMKEIMEERESD